MVQLLPQQHGSSESSEGVGGKAGITFGIMGSFRVMIIIGLMLCGSMRMLSSCFDMKTITLLDPSRTLLSKTNNNNDNKKSSYVTTTTAITLNKTGFLNETLTRPGGSQQEQQKAVNNVEVLPANNNTMMIDDGANNNNTDKKYLPERGGSPPPPSPPPEVAADTNMMMPENPTNLRVLVAVPMYNLKQYPHFERWLDSLYDLCSSHHEMQTLHIVIYTTVRMPAPILKDIEARATNCRKNLKNFKLRIRKRSSSVRLRLVDEHRNMFYKQINNYDLFVYNEEDINIRPKHIFAYWRETAILQNRLPADQFADYSIGFLRCEEPTTTEFKKTPRYIFEFDWDTKSPKAFAKKHIISRLIPFTGSYYFNAGVNFHQGMYMATASQLKNWKERGPSCSFNDASRIGEEQHREEVSSKHLFDPRGCNVTQLIPANGYNDFLVHHMSNRYWHHVDWRGKRISSSDLGDVLADAIDTLEEGAQSRRINST